MAAAVDTTVAVETADTIAINHLSSENFASPALSDFFLLYIEPKFTHMNNLAITAPIAGCMRWGIWGAGFTTEQYSDMIDACLDAGIFAFDHADIYGDYTTEAEFGKALQGKSEKRQKMQLITKCGIQMKTPNRPQHTIKSYNTTAAHIIQSAEHSLQNLQTDYLDLLLIHRPDPLLHPEAVAEAVTQLQQTGKIISFGVSNFLPTETSMLKKWVPIAYNQIECSLLMRDAFTNGTLSHCIEHKIIPMAWAPLGGGIISDETHPRFRAIRACTSELAAKYQTGENQILLAWLLRHPSGILPVVGTTKLERLLEAKEAQSIQLEREDWFRLLEAAAGEEVA